ncbi:MAG: histidine phosphatase family protein [Mycobacteriales bacterium]
MSEIVIVRHGETEWSRSGRHTGNTDIPLNPEGERQAERLRLTLAGRSFGLALCSPRRRARRTAELAGIAGVETDANLIEWDYGYYEGRTTHDIGAELGRPWSLWEDGVPGGETLGEVAARTAAVLDRARPILATGADVALIAHGHILRVLAAGWLGLPPAAGALFVLSAGSLGILGFEHDRSVLSGWNIPVA